MTRRWSPLVLLIAACGGSSDVASPTDEAESQRAVTRYGHCASSRTCCSAGSVTW
jgi:hypothetical protein